MKNKTSSKFDAAKSSGTSPTSIPPRGMRVEIAAYYSGLSPFYLEELIRSGALPAIGGPGTGIAAYVVLREKLDQYLDELGQAGEARAEERRKQRVAA